MDYETESSTFICQEIYYPKLSRANMMQKGAN